MNWIKKIIAKFVVWLKPEYKFQFTEDFPTTVEGLTIYVIGDQKAPWLLAFQCPCGCKQAIQLNLLKEADPNWKFKITPKNKISISPSIWRTVGCKSHFFIRNSKVDWARSIRNRKNYL